MDHLGKRRGTDKPLMPASAAGAGEEMTAHLPTTNAYPRTVHDTGAKDEESGNSSATQLSAVSLKLRKDADEDAVSYAFTLSRYVASLARENRTAEILALYSGEINKYPDEQGLYEQRLQWLGQTNLIEEQLRVIQDASNRASTNR